MNTRRVAELIEGGAHACGGTQGVRGPGRGEDRGDGARAPTTRVSTQRAEARFKANRAAWEFFNAQPPGYRRMATWFVMSAKRDETRLKRLVDR